MTFMWRRYTPKTKRPSLARSLRSHLPVEGRRIGNDGAVTCFSGAQNMQNIYTFFANGDLNNDHVYSTFEMTVGSDDSSQLHHSRGLYIVAEPE